MSAAGMEARVFRLRLKLRNTFRIAHGAYTYRENLFVALSAGGKRGLGEAPIVPYYGLSAGEVEADLRRGLTPRALRKAIEGEGPPRGDFIHAVSRAAFQAAALALRKELGLEAMAPVSRATARGEAAPGDAAPGDAVLGDAVLGDCPQSSFTVAYDDDPELMAEQAAACGFRRLKIKAGIPGDIKRIGVIRERLPEALIRVDANQGWSPGEAPERLAALERLGVEFVEEPCACEPARLEAIAAGTSLPIVLDESAKSVEELRRFADAAPSLAGVVVKAAKNGGPAESRAVAEAARELGLRVMLSSMVETSLGVASVLDLAPLCDWVDLDAPLLLAEDPFEGLSYREERPVAESRGVRPGAGLESLIAATPPLFEED